MAKVVKSTRDVMDVNEEVKKVTKSKEKSLEKKQAPKEKKKGNKVKKEKQKHGLFGFFREVKSEVSKVKWPSRKDMVKYSAATISFVIFFGVFFYLIETIMAIVKAWV